MKVQHWFLFAADVTLLLHVLFVAFVVVGLVLIVVGKYRAWSWVRNRGFRFLHLLAICTVVVQAWLGVVCPLTTLEMWLRGKAGDAVYSGSFIAHWLENLLYYQAPAWVFIACYTLFGLLVVYTWAWVRPHPVASRDINRME